MKLTRNLHKSQLETIALEAYNNAIDDMIRAGLIESHNLLNHTKKLQKIVNSKS